MLDETVISGDSFVIRFTPVVEGISNSVSYSITQDEIISNSKIDPRLGAQKVATLSVSGVNYSNRKDDDYADITVYCEYSFKRPDGTDSGNITLKSNVIRIRQSSGGGGGGGCDAGFGVLPVLLLIASAITTARRKK